MTAFKLHTSTRKILATLTVLLLAASTLVLSLTVIREQKPRRLQSSGVMYQGGAHGVPTVPRADQVVNFAGNETVQGRGKVWSLKFVANPDSLQLVFRSKGFAGVTLFRDIDYSLSGRAVKTFNSFPKGTVRAWYRY